MKKGISLAGVWLWLWGLWHVGWIGAIIVVPYFFGAETWVDYASILYAVFLPLELIGAYDLRDDVGRERAKTLSQWRQFVAEMGHEDARDGWISWAGLAGLTGIIDAFMVATLTWYRIQFVDGVLFPGFTIILSVLVGVTLAAWLVPHFGWRHKAG